MATFTPRSPRHKVAANSQFWDPAFIGWVRQYKGPFFAEAWDQIDGDVDGLYLDACGNEDADEHVDAPCKPLDDETLKSLLQWRELRMRPRKMARANGVSFISLK